MDKQRRGKLTASEEKLGYGQLTDIYSAWLSYLLMMQGQGQMRVKVSDISERIGKFGCNAYRDGDEYVIKITEAPKVTVAGEDGAVMWNE